MDIMQPTKQLQATVLPGKRVEFTAPELTEGECVEVIVLKAENVVETPRMPDWFNGINCRREKVLG